MKKKKLVIIGIDSLMPTVLEKLVERNELPTFKKLMEEGAYSRAYPFYPTETGCNWATIATGATPAKHGCKYVLRLPGRPLDKSVWGFSSEYCRAEQIWQVVDKLGDLSIILDYPQSYPINIKNVVHVGEDGYPGPNSRFCIANAHAYKTEEPPPDVPEYLRAYTTRIKVKPAEGWKNLPEGEFLETEIPLKTRFEELKFYLLIEKRGEVFDKVSLFTEKDYEKKLGEAAKGSWSNWMKYSFKLYDKRVEAYFRIKLIDISPDGRRLHVYFTQIYPAEGWSHPPELARELVEKFGPYLHRPTEQALVVSGAEDPETFIEEQEYQAEWYAKTAQYLLKKYEWRLFIMKWHGPDFFQHFSLHLIDPTHPLFNKDKEEDGWKLYARFYRICDNLVSSILEAVDEENTVVCVVSDHGHVANVVTHVWNDVLEKAGLFSRKPDGSIDWSKTKAFIGGEGVWINLKGRYPHGIVEPGEEYEEVREQVIKLLSELKDPLSGAPIFSLVCRKEDTGILGMGGDRDPDIVICYHVPLKPKVAKKTILESPPWGKVTGTHGPFLPSARTLVGTIESVFLIKGPSVKRGYRRKYPISLADVAPTLCYLAGLPIPRDADGKILYDIIEYL
ncbi:MAG: hypothetical protein DRN04_08390 [Thermoprotei archaeon]|nr:MAG: hypothetical protein DRN04_08390 [Thermoprotei archaeon]